MGKKVIESKTECCIFYKNNTTPKTLIIGGTEVTASQTINMLGITFNSKLSWGLLAATTISKAERASNVLKLIRKFFNTKSY